MIGGMCRVTSSRGGESYGGSSGVRLPSLGMGIMMEANLIHDKNELSTPGQDVAHHRNQYLSSLKRGPSGPAISKDYQHRLIALENAFKQCISN